MRFLTVVLIATVAIGGGFVALAATDNIPFLGETAEPREEFVQERRTDPLRRGCCFRLPRASGGARPPPGRIGRVAPAWRLAAGAGPARRFQAVRGGLRNVVGEVRGRDPGSYLVVGAHYDTKDLSGFVGANDGASGTAVVLELARTIEPGELEPTVVFAFFDGEESPAGTPDEDFAEEGSGKQGRGGGVPGRGGDGQRRLRRRAGAVAAPEENSDPELWEELEPPRSWSGTVGFAPETQPGVLDDHTPFLERVPAIDLIDFDFDCFHRPCDDLSAAPESLDAAGEPVLELLRELGQAR